MTSISSVKFHNYKAFTTCSISIKKFNILVGPNNSGKSTIIGAFKILAEALRKAQSKNPILVTGPNGTAKGYQVDLRNMSVVIENVFHDYNSENPAIVTFFLTNGNKLLLYFPEENKCHLIPISDGTQVNNCAQFKKQFGITIGFVPILGPVEHNEQLYQKNAARLALIAHSAARNFRNIWYHYPENFNEFKMKLCTSWPGMDIDPPEVDYSHEKTQLNMFCPEDRIPRELFWAGFGFQVWCQMLTFIVKNKESALFLIDEPDIYLHSDLQRQLLSILKGAVPDN